MHRQSCHSSPWSSPMDPHHLKRRHTRGNTSQSHNSLHSLSSSSPLPPQASSSPSTHSRQHSKHEQDEDRSSPSSRATIHSKKWAKDTEDDDMFRLQQSTVPTWFGSLRSFALSATTSSRGAFTPLVASSSTSPTLPRPQSSNASPSRGRSSSIYYAGTLDDESDSDESGPEQDKPITSLNGLKENRIRGPRMGWALLDPSLGGVFPHSYSAVPGSESDLSSPSCDSSTASSSLSSPTFSTVDELSIIDDTFQDYTKAVSAIQPRTPSDDDGSPPPPDYAIQAYPVASKSAASAFAYLKSYVPTFPSTSTTGPISLGSDEESRKQAPPKSRPMSSSSKNTASSGTGTGWSIRRLSLNFLSSSQYEAVGASESNDEDDETGENIVASLGVGSAPAFRDDPEEEDEQEKNRSQGKAHQAQEDTGYNGSSRGSTTPSSLLFVTKAKQYSPADLLRDTLEQLPVVTNRSLRKQGRTD
ncbi:hypothetical protein BGZ83_010162 [Gryganskiella cystojenkinii]|nr:hypothetical protein BGZ83_010162 [Gryganskiella cystojenkinii]